MKPREITDANFQHEVLDYEGTVLVDFWAAWCAPCRAVGPTIEELVAAYGETAKVGKLDVDENPQIAGEYDINSIPAVLVFRDGKVVETLVGVKSKQHYEQALQRAAA